VQNIQNDDGVGRAKSGAADVGLRYFRGGSQSAARALDIARHEFDTARRQGSRGRGPGARPAAALVAALGGPQPGGQQSLAAAQVQHPRSAQQQTEFEDGAKDRIAAQLAAREVIREQAGVAVRLTGAVEQRGV